jgi:hypothetical protein
MSHFRSLVLSAEFQRLVANNYTGHYSGTATTTPKQYPAMASASAKEAKTSKHISAAVAATAIPGGDP